MTLNRRESASQALPRLAVVGCGAAAKEFCLPVLTKFAGFRDSVVLVDKQLSQAELVAHEFGIQQCCDDFKNLPCEIDAAIITTPHHLHAEQAIHFLQRGTPVFVEKPLGITESEVASMLDAAAKNEVVLMVNNCRRLFPAYQAVGRMIHAGQYGKVARVDIHDGSSFEWNSVSNFYLRGAKGTRGVFLDRGAHTVDMLCSWLTDTPQVIDVRYDAFGGPEALMDVRLVCGEASIQLKFSRLFKLENCYRIECEHAQIGGRLFDSARFHVTRDGETEWITAGEPRLYDEYARQLVGNFVEVIQGRAQPKFVAADVAPSMAVIEEAYRQAQPWELPWYASDPNIAFLREELSAARSG